MGHGCEERSPGSQQAMHVLQELAAACLIHEAHPNGVSRDHIPGPRGQVTQFGNDARTRPVSQSLLGESSHRRTRIVDGDLA